MKEENDLEYLALILSVINSFVLTNSSDIKLILANYSHITHKTIKLLRSHCENNPNKHLYENCFRLLKSLALRGMLSLEKIFNSGFTNSLDDYLISDILYQYICILVEKISESSYYKHYIYQNEKLVDKLINKFFTNKNSDLTLNLLTVLTCLTEDNIPICLRIFNLNILKKISNYIRSYNNNIKIFSINLMINVLSNSGYNYEKEYLVIYSISILSNLLKEEVTLNIKTRCVSIISMIIKKYSALQSVFYNIEGVDTLLKELKDTFSEAKVKEMEDFAKNIKTNKSKRSERVFLVEDDKDRSAIIDLSTTSLDDMGEYRRSIIETLASASSSNEEARKRIIESKEVVIFLSLLEENNSKMVLATSNLLLSLSRAHLSVKKHINEYDITSPLFKLTNHPNVEIQISVTNSLCNFLLDYSSNPNEVIECVSKLLKIMTTNKHIKIRQNAIFSIKNILYYIAHSSNQFRDIKKNILKKLTYEFLLSLLDDEDFIIQEQTLIIFRALLHKSADDIEEVLKNCKTKLVKKIEEKIYSTNKDVTLQSLYVLLNIANGIEKHKLMLLEKPFMKRISELLNSDNPPFRTVCVLILNSLINERISDHYTEKIVSFINEYNCISNLEKISNAEEEDSECRNNAYLLLSKIRGIKTIK